MDPYLLGSMLSDVNGVYKIKLNAYSTLERYKARLVAKDYTQHEGMDFIDIFSPVAKMTTAKTLLAVSPANNWSLTQLDISNAFLKGDLQKEIYMTLSLRYTPNEGETLPPNAVCRLQIFVWLKACFKEMVS